MTRFLGRSSALALVIASGALLSGCADGGGGYAYDSGVGVDYYQPYGGYYGGWGGGYYVSPGRGDGRHDGDHHDGGDRGGPGPVGRGPAPSHAFHAPGAGRSAPSLPHGGGGGRSGPHR